MTVISVDLAHKHYRDVGIVVLTRADDRIVAETIRLTPELGFSGRPDAGNLADFLDQYAAKIGATVILIDGPQAWKSAHNGIEHSRLCERVLATPGKTGLPGTTKPVNYLGFIEFSIDLFDHLEVRGWPRLNAAHLAISANRATVESFPTAAWRSLRLPPLSGKQRASAEEVAAKLRELREHFPLDVASDLNHDEIQALIAGLAGLALAVGNQRGYEIAGTSPVYEDGYWREGFIIYPTRDAAEMSTASSESSQAALVHHPILGRTLRVDNLDTLGVSTQTLAEEAIRAGRVEEAIALVDYFHQEMRIMHTIMRTWLTDITRYIVARGGPSDHAGELATALLDIWRTYPLGEALRERCKEQIRRAPLGPVFAGTPAGADRARRVAEAIALLDQMRLEFKYPHDVLVAWVQDLLTTIAARWGEEAVLESILETHQSIWGDRYENWSRLTPHERLALTVEGMRGGHFSGQRRRGDVTVRDDGDRLVMMMELCGSGGVLRRGDPETGRPPHPLGRGDASAALTLGVTGVNQVPHDWTWQKTGVHWYCSHCAIAMEWLPGRQRGRLLRPLDHVMDSSAPCTWYIYKDEAQTRAYHYPRTGTPAPPDAPDFGEDWRADYPGGFPAAQH